MAANMLTIINTCRVSFMIQSFSHAKTQTPQSYMLTRRSGFSREYRLNVVTNFCSRLDGNQRVVPIYYA